MSRKVKIVRKNPEPAKSSNVNPGQLGQYSATNLVSEDSSLTTYLSSRGINAKNLSKDTKISHAKSNEFKKWKQNHQFEEVVVEDAMLDKYLMSRGVNPEHVPTNQKVAYSKSSAFLIWKKNHMHEDVAVKKSPITDKHQAIIKSKQAGEIIHTNPIKKEGSQTPQLTPEAVQKKPSALERFHKSSTERKKKHDEIEKKSGGMTAAIDRLKKHLNKEEVVNEMDKTQDAPGRDSDHKLGSKEYKGKPITSKTAINQFHKKLDKLVHSTFGKRKNEDVMDPQAAIAKVPDSDPSIVERKKEMSKSARMIKALYKKKGVVKEDMFDHEKEDKSVATYGKKPKFEKADKDDSIGEKKPSAAAILTGGTTLTGEKRDDVEIDPMMRNRPGQPDVTKKDDKKKDEKDGKKEEKK